MRKPKNYIKNIIKMVLNVKIGFSYNSKNNTQTLTTQDLKSL